jgi:dienelactone hydrolase
VGNVQPARRQGAAHGRLGHVQKAPSDWLTIAHINCFNNLNFNQRLEKLGMSKIIMCFLLSLNISFSFAQNSQPMLAVNPHIGWNWKKTEFESMAEDKAMVYLHYRLQANVNAPSVLIGHDNGGITDNEKDYAFYMYGQGFHVFMIDRITSRKRPALPLENILIADTFSAAKEIREKFSSVIAGEKLSYVSFSGDGGFGGLMSIEPSVRKIFSESAPDQFKFDRVATFYPACLDMENRAPDTPTLIIGAELDASDPVVCKKVYKNFPIVTVDIYPEATHGFDQSKVRGKMWIEKPHRYQGTCAWVINIGKKHERDGKYFYQLTTPDGIRQGTPGFSRFNESCMTKEKGYFTEYRADLTRKGFAATVKFLTQ